MYTTQVYGMETLTILNSKRGQVYRRRTSNTAKISMILTNPYLRVME